MISLISCIIYTAHTETYHIITCCYLWHPTWSILGAHDWPWDSGYAWLSQGTIPVISSMYFQFYSCCSFIVLYPSISPILLAQSCRVNWLPWVTSGFPRHRWASGSEGSPLRSGEEFSIQAQMDWLKEKKHEPLQKTRHPNHFDGNLGEDSVRMSPQSQPMFMVPACSHGHLSCKATTIAKCHKIDHIWSPFQTRKLVPWSGRSLSMTLNAHLPEALARQLGSETIALIGHQGDPKVLVNFGKSLEGLTCGLHFIDFHRGYWAYWGLAPPKKNGCASPCLTFQPRSAAKTY